MANTIARRAKVAGETAGKAGKKVGKAAVKGAKAVGKGATSPEARRIYKAALDALGETATAVASGDVIVVGRKKNGKSLARAIAETAARAAGRAALTEAGKVARDAAGHVAKDDERAKTRLAAA